MVEIVTSKCVEVTSATTLSASIDAQAGDIVVATITHRSDTTDAGFSISEGWSLIYTSAAFVNTGMYQFMSFTVRKISSLGTIEIKANQITAGRMYINLIVLRGASDIKFRKDLEMFATTTAASDVIQVPNKIDGKALIWGCSAITWNSTTPRGDWSTNPPDLRLISLPQATTQPRQANFIDVGNGAVSRTFQTDVAGTTLLICAVEIITYIERYVVRNGIDYYTISNNELHLLSDYAQTADYLLANGMDKLPNSPCILELSNPHIMYWRSAGEIPALKVSYTALPKKQLIMQNYDIDFSHESIVSLKNALVHMTGTGLVSFLISLNSGIDWYAYDGTLWNAVDISEVQTANGMNKETLEAITNEQWISFTTEHNSLKYRFAILVELSEINDNLAITDIVMNYINTGGTQ